MEYLVEIITAIGAFLGGGWIVSLYKAKPEKTSIELDNMSKALSELKGVIEIIKDNARTDKETSDNEIRELKEEHQKRISKLENKVEQLSAKIEMKDTVIYSAYNCPLFQKASDCVVLKAFQACHKGSDSSENSESENDE